ALLRRISELEQTVRSGSSSAPATGTLDPARRVSQLEERQRQGESELKRASEHLRSIKSKRFEFRERLAAKEAEIRASPQTGPGEVESARSSLAELRKRLEALQPEADRARTEYEVLQVQFDT